MEALKYNARMQNAESAEHSAANNARHSHREVSALQLLVQTEAGEANACRAQTRAVENIASESGDQLKEMVLQYTARDAQQRQELAEAQTVMASYQSETAKALYGERLAKDAISSHEGKERDLTYVNQGFEAKLSELEAEVKRLHGLRGSDEQSCAHGSQVPSEELPVGFFPPYSKEPSY